MPKPKRALARVHRVDDALVPGLLEQGEGAVGTGVVDRDQPVSAGPGGVRAPPASTGSQRAASRVTRTAVTWALETSSPGLVAVLAGLNPTPGVVGEAEVAVVLRPQFRSGIGVVPPVVAGPASGVVTLHQRRERSAQPMHTTSAAVSCPTVGSWPVPIGDPQPASEKRSPEHERGCPRWAAPTLCEFSGAGGPSANLSRAGPGVGCQPGLGAGCAGRAVRQPVSSACGVPAR